ncbi:MULTISPECIES: FAD:protein FMN transferase [Salinivibrio]|jgi:thiamine biosynthesis lipoprotein|uniref:FAD:protein FMN transferase n=1 Tax=Salinivibrio costicola TaxID=51367 RepID=A0ABX6K1Z1_SALCS|nr:MULTISPECIES: FAD:protein FMN transferase [Salinivibrio]ODQ00949.1 FAD:protein FMN transferase ApbE [Salinivibrio sp. DV]OOF21453.1 FAD:protein FMN transferase ApbE [Salinivibrio sp. IB574]OOF28402.1 FAD:protein FMN transferase ApbE [Salinivibrio sp. IB872]PCE69125.1 FAD:protein FMN transferase [Salinivibrio sp. YCSC6]QCF36446.1 FAD:protein FMN transferase [Salinivibrio sp. YCSC6]
MKKFWLGCVATLTLLVALVGCERSPELVHLNGSTMGTYYSIKYIATENTPEKAVIQKEIDKRLELVNDQMSTYRDDSELSRFNQHRADSPVEVSDATAKVVKEAMRLNAFTDGALDVTVGPLVNLWSFGPEKRPENIPTDEEIAQRMAMTGLESLSLSGNQLTKTNPDLYVDLSTIAKGYGVDVVAEYLASLGLDNYLVEIGGELQLKGVNQDGVPWRIAIEKPSAGTQSVQEIIEPGDMAVATSGDYRNYFEHDGVRYSHIIDPATGRPIHHRLVSVTVLDPSCMTADGLATGFMVLGPEKAVALANQANIPAFMVVKTDDGFKEIASEAFKPYLKR